MGFDSWVLAFSACMHGMNEAHVLHETKRWKGETSYGCTYERGESEGDDKIAKLYLS